MRFRLCSPRNHLVGWLVAKRLRKCTKERTLKLLEVGVWALTRIHQRLHHLQLNATRNNGDCVHEDSLCGVWNGDMGSVANKCGIFSGFYERYSPCAAETLTWEALMTDEQSHHYVTTHCGIGGSELNFLGKRSASITDTRNNHATFPVPIIQLRLRKRLVHGSYYLSVMYHCIYTPRQNSDSCRLMQHRLQFSVFFINPHQL